MPPGSDGTGRKSEGPGHLQGCHAARTLTSGTVCLSCRHTRGAESPPLRAHSGCGVCREPSPALRGALWLKRPGTVWGGTRVEGWAVQSQKRSPGEARWSARAWAVPAHCPDTHPLRSALIRLTCYSVAIVLSPAAWGPFPDFLPFSLLILRMFGARTHTRTRTHTPTHPSHPSSSPPPPDFTAD